MEPERIILAEGLEVHKERLLLDMEKLLSAVREKEEEMNSLQKELSATQWYLGEEKARRIQLEERCQELEAQIDYLGKEHTRLQKELDEANWYLGEERVRRQELEDRIKSS